LTQPGDARLCDHCFQPVAADTQVASSLPDAGPRLFCCQGCAAAAALIANMGLQDYYRFRDSDSSQAPAVMADTELQVFSEPELLAPFLDVQGERRALTLLVEGIHCAACVWLLEQALRQFPDVRQVSVNLASRELKVSWLGDDLSAATLARCIHDLGYRPRLPGATSSPEQSRQQRQLIGRLLVAGLGAMQAMMYAVALYLGALDGIDTIFRDFFRIAGLVIATPVVFYSGWPFFVSAWRALRHTAVNMDVPVSLALLMGWAGSVHATVTGGAHVYFESVSMFVFFLLVSRWLEARQREIIARQFDRLQADMPLMVERLEPEGGSRTVPTRLVRSGDILRVRQGDVVAVDALILEGDALIQEAVLTGEPLPVLRSVEGSLAAGSQLLEGTLVIEARSSIADSALAKVSALVSRAQQQRRLGVFDSPALAAVFVGTVLVLAATTALAHITFGSALAFPAALAVLVVTCPCALAIAAPLTVAASLGRALQQGILVADVSALARLRGVDTFIFDKTGTLTDGHFDVQGYTLMSPRVTEQQALGVVAGLEQHASHPLARALKQLATPATLTNIRLTRTGVSGDALGQRWDIGTVTGAGDAPTSTVQLRCEGEPVLRISLSDRVYAWSTQAVSALKAQQRQLLLLSGDQPGPVTRVAQALDMDAHEAGVAPQEKVDRITALQREGNRVAMVGDGVNDAGALLQADVGIAVAGSTALARDAAHIYLLDATLAELPWLIRLSARMRRVLRQNFAWAIGYNLLAVPFAMLGLVPPWLAALGMSASSLIVTLNAARLSRWKS